MPHSNYAIVIGLDCMTGLQTARILSARGVPVIGIANDAQHFGCRTKVCKKILFADTGSEDLIMRLENLGRRLSAKAVLYPCTDQSVLLISRSRQKLASWYHIVLPEPDVVEMLMNKISFYRFAEQAGLPIPNTFFLHKKLDVMDASEHLTYPCILKPPIKTPEWERNTTAKVYKISSRRELLDIYDKCSNWSNVLMAQEWIPGPDSNLYSCNCYFNSASEPIVTFIARKIRQWPPETGTSCLGQECRNDIVLRDSIRLFKEVNYRGLGYVEIKRDERTGDHFIIEPNIGRPTGRSAIAEAGGVELLYAKYCDVTGRPLPKNLTQKYRNVKWVYLRRDLQSAFYYWRRGDLSVRAWWKSHRGRKGYALLSWSDPLPFFADLKNKIKGYRFRTPAVRSGTTGISAEVVYSRSLSVGSVVPLLMMDDEAS